jgi:N utilization substance protein A
MAYANQAFGSVEIVQIADAVAREKGINRDLVLDAMEQAIQIAGRRKYGAEHNIRAEINRRTGEIQMYRVTTVVPDDMAELAEENELGELIVPEFDEYKHIPLSTAKKLDKELEVGAEIKDPLPPIDFGRIAAQTAKQVIVQKVRDAERDRQYEECKGRVGEIVNGTVKRVEYGNVTVDMGYGEGFIRRDELIPRERFRQGDRIRAYMHEVSRERSGPQVFLSRTRPEFMVKLFAQEVPEIYDGIVEIRAVARDPGSRAKIAVWTNDAGVNPVLSCVGVRGARVQAVVAELQGEKVDIIEYSEDPATFVVNAISSAEVSKVVMDEDSGKIEIVVPDDQLSLAIGRRGQNVRLASQLCGWTIDILTEETESDRRNLEFNRLSDLFIQALDVEEVIAQLLVTEGFTSIQEVAYVPVSELASIEGFDEDVAEELRNRARDWLENEAASVRDALSKLGVSDELAQFDGLSTEVLVKLGEAGVKTLDDLADLAADEFMEIVPDSGMNEKTINDIIMRARQHWFDAEQPK